jgi:hypothetical protein
MSAQNDVSRLERRLQDLKRSLPDLGLAIQGSILKRTIRREDPARPGKTKAYGPYYQWTRKTAGRTTIQNLTATQAKAYARAIRENRRLERIVADMRTVSLRLLELSTPGVVRRRRRNTERAKTLS